MKRAKTKMEKKTVASARDSKAAKTRIGRRGRRGGARTNPFRRFSTGEVDLSDDLLYSSNWKYRSVNCLHSNGGLCCNCLFRKAEVAHHMMYSPLWVMAILKGLLWVEFSARILLRGKKGLDLAQLRTAWLVFSTERLGKILLPRRGRLYDKETIWFHTIPVCKKCHRPGKGVHSNLSWRAYPDNRHLNHNYGWMRWKLRLGWIVTSLLTLPIRLWEYMLYKM